MPLISETQEREKRAYQVFQMSFSTPVPFLLNHAAEVCLLIFRTFPNTAESEFSQFILCLPFQLKRRQNLRSSSFRNLDESYGCGEVVLVCESFENFV